MLPLSGNRRLIPVILWFSLLMTAFTLLRVVLYAAFGPESFPGVLPLLHVFVNGLRFDLVAASWTLLPLLLWMTLLPERIYGSRPHRVLLAAAFILSWSAQAFFMAAEYYFFDEFRVRFNTVAIDYLIYPHEVVNNIRDSYPVGPVVACCLAAGTSLYLLIRPRWNRAFAEPSLPLRRRLGGLAAGVAVVIASTSTVSLEGSRFGRDRLLNELAGNGPYSFIHAAYTHYLDFPAFYRTVEPQGAYERARSLLQEPGGHLDGGERSIQRHIDGDPGRPRYNVVIFLEESFGSEFWGSLGRPGRSLTPEMDALSREGLLFTHMYATGNRTVRGMEGVLASFPPLPGNSIIRRSLSDHVETLARVLKRDGYDTMFLYGGRGIFDGMRSFSVRNGYDRFIEQKDFAHPVFSTIWGVSDEDLYGRALEEMRAGHDSGRPFFATILSVSNHKPYTYPTGRIAEDPEKRRREYAVLYSDWALGDFFKKAKQEAFYRDTIFVVVADHGARVYGSLRIPIHSYEIPLLIVGPGIAPHRVATLGCSLDVAPTVLGLLGRPYESVFFGRDMLHDPPEGARALMHHDRDIGILEDGRLIVLGLNKTAEFYRLDPQTRDFVPATDDDPDEARVENDGIALFQVADDLYTHQHYFTLDPLALSAGSAR